MYGCRAECSSDSLQEVSGSCRVLAEDWPEGASAHVCQSAILQKKHQHKIIRLIFFVLNSEWLWLRQVSRQAGRPYIKSRSSNGEHFIKKSSLHPPNSSFKTLEDYQSKARRSKLVTARQCHEVISSLFTSQKFFSGTQQKISQVERVRPFFFFLFFFVSVLVEKVWDGVGMKIFSSPLSLVPLHTHSVFLHILSFAESDLESRRLNGGRQTEEISIPLVAAVPFSLSGVGSLPRNVTEY